MWHLKYGSSITIFCLLRSTCALFTSVMAGLLAFHATRTPTSLPPFAESRLHEEGLIGAEMEIRWRELQSQANR